MTLIMCLRNSKNSIEPNDEATNRNMKVTLFLPNYRFFEKYGYIGGHIEHVKGSVDGFLSNGFDVELVSSCDVRALEGTFPNKNGRLTFTPIPPLGGRLGHYFLFSLRLFKNALSHREDWIYLRYSTSFLPIFLLFLCFDKIFRTKCTVFLEVNSFASNYYRPFAFLDRLLKHFSMRMIFVSENLNDHWKKLVGRRSKPLVQIIPNGIISNKMRPVLSGSSAFQSLTYLGVLKPHYGIEELCESFSRLPRSTNLELNIIGDGPLRGALEERFGAESRINFIGPLIGDKLIKFIDTTKTVMLYPSIGSFPFQSPVKLYDYLAFGKPIISADQENTRHILSGSGSCVLCNVNSPKALQDAIQNLRVKGAELDELVGMAQKQAMETHGWPKRIRKLLAEM